MQNFTSCMIEVDSQVDQKAILSSIFDSTYKDLELKERMRRITESLQSNLNGSFGQNLELLMASADLFLKQEQKLVGLELMFMPDFIETFGLNEFNTSVKAMEKVTTYMSCEFAVRPFIIQYGDDMMQKMYSWSESENHHVRRLSSEGCRPRLPWAMALPDFKKDPSPVLPILERLKSDESEYVRRSVANNLNDIAKDHPDLVLKTSKKWMCRSKETDALVKHAMRTLLKSNYPGSMELFGYAAPGEIAVKNFSVVTSEIRIGDKIEFRFKIVNTSKKIKKVRLEYAIHFLLANGKNTKKVFKISEREMKPGEKLSVNRKHSFRIITTRTYYPGTHYVSAIVNGTEEEKKAFELKA